MRRENYLHFIASFLIVLVFTIPLSATSTYAVISKVSASGSNGIEGYAKPTDFLSINAKASIAVMR